MLRFIQITMGIASILSLLIILLYIILRPNHIDWLLYTVNEIDTSAIYKMRPDGTHQQKLSPDNVQDGVPQWSPDGRWILFERRTAQTAREIYVMRADGSQLRNLSQHALPDSDASWSPNGQQIAYLSNRDGYQQIYVIQRDGSQRTNISPDNMTWGQPYWSPQGEWIIFQHWLNGLTLYDPATGTVTPLIDTSQTGQIEYVQWAPHGRWLVASAGFIGAVYQIDPKLREINRLGNPLEYAHLPQLSPNSYSLALVEIHSDSDRLVLQNLTTGATRVLVDFDRIGQPRWSPDGRWLVFPALASDNWDIYRIHVDGTRLKNLTQSPTNELEVQWSMSVLVMDWHPLYWLSGTTLILAYLGIVYRELLRAIWQVFRSRYLLNDADR